MAIREIRNETDEILRKTPHRRRLNGNVRCFVLQVSADIGGDLLGTLTVVQCHMFYPLYLL